MNKWKEIWQKRGNDFSKHDDIFEMFCELKRADGFDVMVSHDYYRGFYEEWQTMKEWIENTIGQIGSVYEVGCGSGVNLYLFRELCGVTELGGIDYSEALIGIAGSILGECVECREAVELPERPVYDLVLSDSVFQYFESAEYGMRVLEKMYKKAGRAMIIKEVHDIERKEEILSYRRSVIEDYDTRYDGLHKTFYAKEAFIKFSEEHDCELEIVKPGNTSYLNNDYIFDCYFKKR